MKEKFLNLVNVVALPERTIQSIVFKKECMRSHVRYILIFFAVALYCLHVLRNLVAVYAILPPIFSLLATAPSWNIKKRFNANGIFALALFFCFFVLPMAYSFVWYPDENYGIAILRYLYLIPFAIFCLFLVDKAEYIFFALKIYMFFILFSSLSIIYQILFGAVEWFADASERDGLLRFASLSGSLTAYGVYFCFCLPFLFYIYRVNLIVRFSIFLLIASGVFLSLQKAGIANLIICLSFFFIFCGARDKAKFLFLTLVGASVLFIFDSVMDGYIANSLNNFFRIGENKNIDDIAFSQSVLDRIWELPSILYDSYGWKGMVFGVGLVGGSGTFGFSDYPMTHNGYFDLLFLGGISYLIAFLLIFSYALFNACWSYRNASGIDRDLGLVGIFILMLFAVNFAFAGALFYQPYGGIVFYLFVIYYAVHFRRHAHKCHH